MPINQADDEQQKPLEIQDIQQKRDDRLKALRTLAETGDAVKQVGTIPHSAPKVSASASPSRTRLVWIAGGISCILFVAIIASIIVVHQRISQKADTLPTELGIQFPNGSIGCPSHFAWSPDSKMLAVLGYQSCGQAQDQAGSNPTLALYDPVTGHVRLAVSLGSIIAQVVKQGTTHASYQITMNAPSWAPDGKRIGIFLVAIPQDSANPQTAVASELIYSLSTGALVAAILPNTTPLLQITNDRYSAATIIKAPVSALFDLASRNGTTYTPSALRYTWGANDTLTPVTGTQIKGALWPESYTGVLEMMCPVGAPAFFRIATGGDAWAPDGRAIAPLLGGYGALSVPVTSGTAPSGCWPIGKSGLPVVANPISGLSGIESSMIHNQLSAVWFNTNIGATRIATLDSGPNGSGDESEVTLYDGKTGTRLVTYTADAIMNLAHLTASFQTSSTPTLDEAQPSPDGKALAILDYSNQWIALLRAPHLG